VLPKVISASHLRIGTYHKSQQVAKKAYLKFSGKHYLFICYQLSDIPHHRAGSRSKANAIFLAAHFLSSPFPKTLKLPFITGTERNMSDKQTTGVFHYVIGACLFNVHSQIH